jgi:23S rRNA (cytosine1962-C5)-methyltransferase
MVNRIVSKWNANEYRLVDFGDGRKLEEFNGVLLDRPCPAAENSSRSRDANWDRAKRISKSGKQQKAARFPDWTLPVDEIGMKLGLRLTPFGHVGVFPEQLSNWRWLQQQVQRLASGRDALQCLNLFAYTGGSTLALALAGQSVAADVQVVHVDAAQPTVKWASENAELSGLQSAPIRWIVEDASKFAQREVRRRRQYQVIVLDPPTFGHGPSGRRRDMRLELQELVANCCQLLDPGGGCILLTGHSTLPSDIDCEQLLTSHLEHAGQKISNVERGRSVLISQHAGELDAGYLIRTICAG